MTINKTNININISIILDYIISKFPNAKVELNYETPFQLIVAVVLSAQTTDKQVNKVTEILFQTIREPRDMVVMGQKTFEDKIKSIGFFRNKAKNIYNLAIKIQGFCVDDWRNSKEVMKLYKQYGYVVPDTLSDLMVLPGVGEKTAKVVLGTLYGYSEIAVDTHVHRIMNRLGIVDESTPLKTSKQLEKVIPDQYKKLLHHALVLFGRYHCKARKPMCEECEISKYCKYFNKLRIERLELKN